MPIVRIGVESHLTPTANFIFEPPTAYPDKYSYASALRLFIVALIAALIR